MVKPSPPEERLHKHLAGLGVGSRRTIESWIEQGKITVDGRVAQLGDKVGQHSRISVDGRPLRSKPSARQRVILYNKPEGEISTRKDPENRPTVFRHLPELNRERWVAVGRLDINTRGLMLFTNDGELANRLMHPRFNIEREYLCRVYGKVDADSVERLKQGIMLDGKPVRFEQVRRQPGHDPDTGRNMGKNTWYSVVINEGKYREVRRMWESVGGRISRLIRVRYGNLALPKSVKPGEWQELKPAAISRLLQPQSPAAGEKPPDQSRKNSGRKKTGRKKAWPPKPAK